ncbi:hypothetical protein [Variovorax paradoxus]|uniref:hypothetical protein n=1 Tax=Variovorax paradoxus TaxID=34073 RepID=UPI0027832F50|nr:hypothetical protein [Variovorax paradoxus]MDQ0591362.1 hypothetical protein [Variovorax paradoxus]
MFPQDLGITRGARLAPPVEITAERIAYIDNQSIIRMVGFVGEVIHGAADFQARTLPAAVVDANRVEPGARVPAGYEFDSALVIRT